MEVSQNYETYFSRSTHEDVPSDVKVEKVYLTYCDDVTVQRGVVALIMTDEGNYLCIKSLYEDGDTVLVPEKNFYSLFKSRECHCFDDVPTGETLLGGHEFLIADMDLRPYLLGE